ncbi:hypothetical protein [Pyrobaculum sp.]|uniref:hypothetical protein n=1 Tax=Pyrobaculum sp. TaxID=2004705 RepID=UPI0031625237
MEHIAVALATVVYLALLLLTYYALLMRSPPGYNKPTKKELAVIALIVVAMLVFLSLLLSGLQ